MGRMTKRGFLACVLVGTALSACGRLKTMGRMLSGLAELQAKITKEFGETEVGIEIVSGSQLTVSLTNSPSAKLPPVDKEKRARAIAAFAKRNYAEPVEQIAVQFVVEKSFAVVHYTDNHDNFTFTSSELEQPTHLDADGG